MSLVHSPFIGLIAYKCERLPIYTQKYFKKNT